MKTWCRGNKLEELENAEKLKPDKLVLVSENYKQ